MFWNIQEHMFCMRGARFFYPLYKSVRPGTVIAYPLYHRTLHLKRSHVSRRLFPLSRRSISRCFIVTNEKQMICTYLNMGAKTYKSPCGSNNFSVWWYRTYTNRLRIQPSFGRQLLESCKPLTNPTTSWFGDIENMQNTYEYNEFLVCCYWEK